MRPLDWTDRPAKMHIEYGARRIERPEPAQLTPPLVVRLTWYAMSVCVAHRLVQWED